MPHCVCTHDPHDHDRLGVCEVLACGCRDFTTPPGTGRDDDLELAAAVGVARGGES